MEDKIKKTPAKIFEERIIKALKKLREEQGLSPEDIDEKAHYNKGFIRWLETLDSEIMTVADIYKYAKAIGYSPLISFIEDQVEEAPKK